MLLVMTCMDVQDASWWINVLLLKIRTKRPGHVPSVLHIYYITIWLNGCHDAWNHSICDRLCRWGLCSQRGPFLQQCSTAQRALQSSQW